MNLVLEVFFQGNVDKTSNLVINFFNVDTFLKDSVTNWDHKEFVDISFSDLANVVAVNIKENWPFSKAKLTKVSLCVKEPFQEAVNFF